MNIQGSMSTSFLSSLETEPRALVIQPQSQPIRLSDDFMKVLTAPTDLVR